VFLHKYGFCAPEGSRGSPEGQIRTPGAKTRADMGVGWVERGVRERVGNWPDYTRIPGMGEEGVSQHPRAASPRAAPAVQAARPQPPGLSVRCGARQRPAGGIQRWPAAGAGRAGRPQARASAGRVAAGWHGVGGRRRWQRPFDFPIPVAQLQWEPLQGDAPQEEALQEGPQHIQ
jgi:hypothetical protein